MADAVPAAPLLSAESYRRAQRALDSVFASFATDLYSERASELRAAVDRIGDRHHAEVVRRVAEAFSIADPDLAFGRCGTASNDVARILMALGVEARQVGGRVPFGPAKTAAALVVTGPLASPDQYVATGVGPAGPMHEPHQWVQTLAGAVDVTAAQFGLPPAYVYDGADREPLVAYAVHADHTAGPYPIRSREEASSPSSADWAAPLGTERWRDREAGQPWSRHVVPDRARYLDHVLATLETPDYQERSHRIRDLIDSLAGAPPETAVRRMALGLAIDDPDLAAGACGPASNDLSRLLVGMGFQARIVQGLGGRGTDRALWASRWRPSEGQPVLDVHHVWVEAEGLSLDPTAAQFGPVPVVAPVGGLPHVRQSVEAASVVFGGVPLDRRVGPFLAEGLPELGPDWDRYVSLRVRLADAMRDEGAASASAALADILYDRYVAGFPGVGIRAAERALDDTIPLAPDRRDAFLRENRRHLAALRDLSDPADPAEVRQRAQASARESVFRSLESRAAWTHAARLRPLIDGSDRRPHGALAREVALLFSDAGPEEPAALLDAARLLAAAGMPVRVAYGHGPGAARAWIQTVAGVLDPRSARYVADASPYAPSAYRPVLLDSLGPEVAAAQAEPLADARWRGREGGVWGRLDLPPPANALDPAERGDRLALAAAMVRPDARERDRIVEGLSVYPAHALWTMAQRGLRFEIAAPGEPVSAVDARYAGREHDHDAYGVYDPMTRRAVLRDSSPFVVAHEAAHAWDHLAQDRPADDPSGGAWWHFSDYVPAFRRGALAGAPISPYGVEQGRGKPVEWAAEVIRASLGVGGFGLADDPALVRAWAEEVAPEAVRMFDVIVEGQRRKWEQAKERGEHARFTERKSGPMVVRGKGRNMFHDDAEALVITVNLVGAMGKGNAEEAARRFRRVLAADGRTVSVLDAYRAALAAKQLDVGRPFPVRVVDGMTPKWLVLVPTKRHWSDDSRLEDVVAAVDALPQVLRRIGVSSVAVPGLGTSNGHLEPTDVFPHLLRAFRDEDIEVRHYFPQGVEQGLSPRKAFVAGSISVRELPPAAVAALDRAIEAKWTILVGDAPGVDSLVQAHLKAREYHDVVVYHMDRCRNNLGRWPSKAHRAPAGARGGDYYAVKDRAMDRDANAGLMVWDGSSRGTKNNILALLAAGKQVSVVERGAATTYATEAAFAARLSGAPAVGFAPAQGNAAGAPNDGHSSEVRSLNYTEGSMLQVDEDRNAILGTRLARGLHSILIQSGADFDREANAFVFADPANYRQAVAALRTMTDQRALPVEGTYATSIETWLPALRGSKLGSLKWHENGSDRELNNVVRFGDNQGFAHAVKGLAQIEDVVHLEPDRLITNEHGVFARAELQRLGAVYLPDAQAYVALKAEKAAQIEQVLAEASRPLEVQRKTVDVARDLLGDGFAAAVGDDLAVRAAEGDYTRMEAQRIVEKSTESLGDSLQAEVLRRHPNLQEEMNREFRGSRTEALAARATEIISGNVAPPERVDYKGSFNAAAGPDGKRAGGAKESDIFADREAERAVTENPFYLPPVGEEHPKRDTLVALGMAMGEMREMGEASFKGWRLAERGEVVTAPVAVQNRDWIIQRDESGMAIVHDADILGAGKSRPRIVEDLRIPITLGVDADNCVVLHQPDVAERERSDDWAMGPARAERLTKAESERVTVQAYLRGRDEQNAAINAGFQSVKDNAIASLVRAGHDPSKINFVVNEPTQIGRPNKGEIIAFSRDGLFTAVHLLPRREGHPPKIAVVESINLYNDHLRAPDLRRGDYISYGLERTESSPPQVIPYDVQRVPSPEQRAALAAQQMTNAIRTPDEQTQGLPARTVDYAMQRFTEWHRGKVGFDPAQPPVYVEPQLGESYSGPIVCYVGGDHALMNLGPGDDGRPQITLVNMSMMRDRDAVFMRPEMSVTVSYAPEEQGLRHVVEVTSARPLRDLALAWDTTLAQEARILNPELAKQIDKTIGLVRGNDAVEAAERTAVISRFASGEDVGRAR